VPLKNVHSPHGERSPGGNYWVLMEYNEFHRLYKVNVVFCSFTSDYYEQLIR
jgi:hypothetical protein